MKKDKQPFDNQIAIYQSPDGLVNIERELDQHLVGAKFAHTAEDFYEEKTNC